MKKNSDTLKRHPAAIAWSSFLESTDGQQCANVTTLYDSKVGDRQYLENRLHTAFMAGYNAAKGSK